MKLRAYIATLHAALFAILLAASPAGSGSMTLLGAGAPATAAAAYTGPGDLSLGTFRVWYSCATAYSAAFAATLGAVCDVVDTATGLTTCTFHMQATGSVNPAECNGTACATACKVTKAYNQVNSGTNDAVQATLAIMPTLTVSGLHSLPGITCGAGTCLLVSSALSSTTQPFTYVGVYKQNSSSLASGIIGDDNGSTWLGTDGTNTFAMGANTKVTAAAADGSYHAATGLASGSGNNCAINVDGSDTAALNCGVSNIGTAAIRINRANGSQSFATIMEAGVIAATTTSGDRNSYSSNAHTRYSF